jgi:hypothetical protein
MLAAREIKPKRKQEYLEREAHWLRLAANSNFSEQFNRWPARLSSAAPAWTVMEARPKCPLCGMPMWLLVIVESAEGAASHFECVNCDDAHLEAQRSGFMRLGEVSRATSASDWPLGESIDVSRTYAVLASQFDYRDTSFPLGLEHLSKLNQLLPTTANTLAWVFASYAVVLTAVTFCNQRFSKWNDSSQFREFLDIESQRKPPLLKRSIRQVADENQQQFASFLLILSHLSTHLANGSATRATLPHQFSASCIMYPSSKIATRTAQWGFLLTGFVATDYGLKIRLVPLRFKPHCEKVIRIALLSSIGVNNMNRTCNQTVMSGGKPCDPMRKRVISLNFGSTREAHWQLLLGRNRYGAALQARAHRSYDLASLSYIASTTARNRAAWGRDRPTIIKAVLPTETTIAWNRSPALLQGNEIAIGPTTTTPAPTIFSTPTIGVGSQMRCNTSRDNEGKHRPE